MIPASMDVLKSLFGALEDGVCVADGWGRIQYMNPAAARLLKRAGGAATPVRVCDELCGYLDTPAGLAQRAPCPLLDESSSARGVTFEGIRDGEARGLRVRCLRMNADSKTPLAYPGHFILIEDASEEADARRGREDWRSMMVHDLRVPLSCAFGALRALQDAPGERGKEDGEMLEIGVRSCRKMADLLEEFLDTARLMSGAAAPMEATNASLVASACVRELAAAALARRIEIAVRVPEALMVMAEPRLLSRLLQNLIDNALKHTPAGGRVEISAREEGGAVQLRVKDSGEGIPKEARPRLFERFYRAPRDGRGGFGLGLAFCREAARAMGGDVCVAASSPVGTEMLVSLRPAAAGGPS